MLFNTVSYILFLVLATAAYWLLPKPHRIWLVLAASLLFYALWRVDFVFLISFSAFVDYFFSLKIYDETHEGRRKIWLLCSLGINLGLLVYFKYTHFLIDDVTMLGALIGQDWAIRIGNIVLPLGISFYTFLSISYTLDVYRRLFVPVRNFWVYLTYVMFWPHMIAGPILRAHELIPQIAQSRPFESDRFASGIRKILFGLFLKVALADQISPYVDEAFLSAPAQLSALDVWTMAFAFGLQIYFDFAGYSMIAIGSARLIGIEFPENFNWPYLATSPRDFWQRWHITLSSWIRDYLYLPLCGVPFQDRSGGGLEIEVVKPSSARSALALFMTWFLMGLWHGAAWKFAFWGVWHAVFIWLYRLVSPRLSSLPLIVRNFGGWGITLAISMLAWIPFRAPSLSYSFALYARLLNIHAYHALTFRENFYLIVAGVLMGMLGLNFLSAFRGQTRFRRIEQIVEVVVVAFVAIVVFIFLRPVGQFIYFQF
jgi:D-alanyl-lipoteichoic acid acyltransferase DltB (MBOAT superfamily)